MKTNQSTQGLPSTTMPDFIVKTNLVSLTKRLESDLRDGTFEKETVDVIELI